MFFFDDCRSDKRVDVSFESGALVVFLIDASCESDKVRSEIAHPFALSDSVFDLPEGAVCALQFRRQSIEAVPRDIAAPLQVAQQGQFAPDIEKFSRVRDALRLDFQNGEFVDQFSDRRRKEKRAA